MDVPATIEAWVKEIYSFYNKSLTDHVYLHHQEPASFYYRQFKFAHEYAVEARKANVDKERIEAIKAWVLHLFATLPEKYDSQAAEDDFAFAFCYLYANLFLTFIDKKMVWEVLAYITHNWDEGEALIEIPEGIY